MFACAHVHTCESMRTIVCFGVFFFCSMYVCFAVFFLVYVQIVCVFVGVVGVDVVTIVHICDCK